MTPPGPPLPGPGPGRDESKGQRMSDQNEEMPDRDPASAAAGAGPEPAPAGVDPVLATNGADAQLFPDDAPTSRPMTTILTTTVTTIARSTTTARPWNRAHRACSRRLPVPGSVGSVAAHRAAGSVCRCSTNAVRIGDQTKRSWPHARGPHVMRGGERCARLCTFRTATHCV